MNTETVAATAAVAAAPIEQQPVTPPAKPQVTTSELPPEALVQRLERERNASRAAALAELGVTNIDEAKAAIQEAAARKEAAKTTEERLAALELRAKSQAEALSVAVLQAAASITPEQKAAVDAIAGDDQSAWLKTFGVLSKTWASHVAVAAQPPVAPPPAPATTAPTTPAPSPNGQSTSPPDRVAEYAALKKSNPFLASKYLDKYGSECFPK